MTDSAEPRLAAEKIKVERGGKTIVRDVDVQAAAGEVVGVLGPSGAGKSTFFRAIVGETKATGGRVKLDGEDVSDWPLWRRARAGFGYVPQTPSVLFDLTVRQNLETFVRIALGPDASSDPAKTAKEVQLDHRLDVKAGELSAGERRRLECARALVR
ncbi:MAG TPA: ATP-binding cassette domain-containing protein, partial [Polyangiaceae bacterium]